MDGEKADRRRGTSKVTNIWRLIFVVIAAIAIIQELRKPQDQRTWHGKVADFVPYDFRKPTMERVKDTYWNPDGPIFSGKVFGAGWALNIGRLAQWFKRGDE